MRRAAAALAALAAALLCSGAAAAPSRLTVGAYYYAWYGPERSHWEKGYVRERLAEPQRPALGEYDSRDPATIAAHFGWARRYGVDVFIASWWGPGGYDDVTLRDHVLPSPARAGTRIALLYESIQRLGTTENRIVFDDAAQERLLADFDYLAETYLRHPAYYRVGGRPVVFLYVSRIYRGEYERALRALRAHVRARHGLDLYLVGDEVDWDLGPARARIRLFDAITGYTMYSRTQPQTGFLGLVERRLRAFRRVAAQQGVPFVPGVLPGFNDRGVRPEEDHYVLPHGGPLFSRFLEVAGTLVDPSLRLLTVTSWNEWHEDTQIEPTAPAATSLGPAEATGGHAYHSYGFALLERLARFKARWEAAYRARSRRR